MVSQLCILYKKKSLHSAQMGYKKSKCNFTDTNILENSY